MVDGYRSRLVNVVSGVPDGNILGPLLFLIYTSELFSILENKLIGYADDSTLMAVVSSPDIKVPVAKSLKSDLGKIIEWCNLGDEIICELDKDYDCLPVTQNASPVTPINYIIGGTVLKESDDLDILGATFDS